MRLPATTRRRPGPWRRWLSVDVVALVATVAGLAVGGVASPVATSLAVASTANVVTLQDGGRVVLENQTPAVIAQVKDQFGAPYRLLPSDVKVALVTFTDLGLSPSGPATGVPIVRTAPVADTGRIIAPTSVVTVRTPGHWLGMEFSYRGMRLVVDPVMWSNGATPRQVSVLTPSATTTDVRVADPAGAVNPGQDGGAAPAFGDPEGQVTGSATDSGGQPMPYRRVLLTVAPAGWCWFSAAPDGHGLSAQTAVMTDAAGRFGGRYLVCLHSGAGTLTAGTVVSGVGPRASAQLQTVPPAAPTRVVLTPATVRSGASLRATDLGVVTNGLGEPVAGVPVDLVVDDPAVVSLTAPTVTTDAAGRMLVDLDSTLYRAGPVGLTATIAGQTQDAALGPDWNPAFLGSEVTVPSTGRYRAGSVVTVTPVPAVVRLSTKPLGGGRVRLVITLAPRVMGPLTLYTKVGGRWQPAHRWTSDRAGTASIVVWVRLGAARPFRVDFGPPQTLGGSATKWVSVTG